MFAQPPCALHVLTSVCMLKNPNTGSHTTIVIHEKKKNVVRLQRECGGPSGRGLEKDKYSIHAICLLKKMGYYLHKKRYTEE